MKSDSLKVEISEKRRVTIPTGAGKLQTKVKLVWLFQSGITKYVWGAKTSSWQTYHAEVSIYRQLISYLDRCLCPEYDLQPRKNKHSTTSSARYFVLSQMQTKSSFLETLTHELTNNVIARWVFLVSLKRGKLIPMVICCYPSAQNTSWS